MQEYETSFKNVAKSCNKITDPMLKLTIGKEIAFPLIQFDSVNTAKQRLQKKYKAKGWRWSTATNATSIVVTRVA